MIEFFHRLICYNNIQIFKLNHYMFNHDDQDLVNTQ